VSGGKVWDLRVEYAEQTRTYGILFLFSLFCEYSILEHVRVPVKYRVNTRSEEQHTDSIHI